MPRQKKPDWKKCLEEKTIMSGLARVCDRKKSGDNFFEILRVDIGGYTVYIKKEDAVLYSYSNVLSRLVGSEVRFCIKEIVPATADEEEKVYGSMKLCREELIAPIKARLESGSVETGKIVSATLHGAYIAIGDLKGFMKNSDFSDNGEEIRDYFQKGDEIKVKFKKYSQSGFLYLVPEEKPKSSKKVKRKDIAEGMVMMGTITKAYPDRVYVKVLPKIEAMCFNEQMGTLRVGDEVQVKIQRIWKPDKWLMVRGKVLGKVPKKPAL